MKAKRKNQKRGIFTPFTIELTIESAQEAAYLWILLNRANVRDLVNIKHPDATEEDLIKLLKDENGEPVSASDFSLWKTIDNELREQGLL